MNWLVIPAEAGIQTDLGFECSGYRTKSGMTAKNQRFKIDVRFYFHAKESMFMVPTISIDNGNKKTPSLLREMGFS
jgi:hypothetical protein